MKISKKALKQIIAEEIKNVLESKSEHEKYYPSEGTPEFAAQQAELSGEPHPDAPTGHDEQMINDLLNQIGQLLGHDMPDVVGLEAGQLAGAVSDAIERWKKKQQLSPTGKSNLGTGLPRDPKTPEPVEVEWE